MITKYLAEKFISKISTYALCNINIMDDKGIIIASKDVSRIGNFHEIAYRMVRDSIPEFSVRDRERYTGVKPGINLTVLHDSQIIGVIGLSGDPDRLRDTAFILKALLEEMLSSEDLRAKNGNMPKKSSSDSFFQLLCTPSQASAQYTEYYARRLDYQEMLRIPILVQADTGNLPEDFRELLTASAEYSSQDIIFAQNDFQIMIFKSYRDSFERFSHEYRQYAEDFLAPLTEALTSQGISFRVCVGSFQNQWKYYFYGYRHCLWMKESLTNHGTILYFYDYVDLYLNSLVPFWELHGMFNVYSSETDDDFRSNFISIIRALIRHNYNLTETSKALFIHKNTLILRFSKIRDFLNMSPFHNDRDKELCKYLTYYFSELK